jgi:hypothetical protein
VTVDLIKIRIRLSPSQGVETLWAQRIGDNLFRLDNSPFRAYGLSWQDIVQGKLAEDGGIDFVRRIEKSGNRTLRVIFENGFDNTESRVILEQLRKLGCSYEGMRPRTISINVPPEIVLDNVIYYLKNANGLEWEYADPTYEEVVRAGD